MANIEYLQEENNRIDGFRRYIVAAGIFVGSLAMISCSSEESSTTETLSEPIATIDESSTQTTEVEATPRIDSTTVPTTAVESSTSIDSTTTTNPLEDDGEPIDSTDQSETELDTSNWNLSPDKIEILTYLATEHGYPVSAEKGDFSEGASYDEILFEASVAFMASRNTHSLVPLANYFGYETVDEWASNTSESVYGIEDSFNEMFFYRVITDPDEGSAEFDRSFGQVRINEQYLSNGNRRLTSNDDTALESYSLQVPFDYSGGGIDDPSFDYFLSEDYLSSRKFLSSNMTVGYGLVLEIAPDGRIAEFTVSYI